MILKSVASNKENKRVSVSFRLKPPMLIQLKALAKSKNLSNTQVIEQLIAYCYEKDIKKK